jgi:hypothetical protein
VNGNRGDGANGLTQSNEETEKNNREEFFFSVFFSVALLLRVIPFPPSPPFPFPPSPPFPFSPQEDLCLCYLIVSPL